MSMTSFVVRLKDLIIHTYKGNPRYGVGAHARFYCEATVDVVGVIGLGRWVPYAEHLEELQENERDRERWVKVTFKEVGMEEMVCGCRRIITDVCFATVTELFR